MSSSTIDTLVAAAAKVSQGAQPAPNGAVLTKGHGNRASNVKGAWVNANCPRQKRPRECEEPVVKHPPSPEGQPDRSAWSRGSNGETSRKKQEWTEEVSSSSTTSTTTTTTFHDDPAQGEGRSQQKSHSRSDRSDSPDSESSGSPKASSTTLTFSAHATQTFSNKYHQPKATPAVRSASMPYGESQESTQLRQQALQIERLLVQVRKLEERLQAHGIPYCLDLPDEDNNVVVSQHTKTILKSLVKVFPLRDFPAAWHLDMTFLKNVAATAKTELSAVEMIMSIIRAKLPENPRRIEEILKVGEAVIDQNGQMVQTAEDLVSNVLVAELGALRWEGFRRHKKLVSALYREKLFGIKVLNTKDCKIECPFKGCNFGFTWKKKSKTMWQPNKNGRGHEQWWLHSKSCLDFRVLSSQNSSTDESESSTFSKSNSSPETPVGIMRKTEDMPPSTESNGAAARNTHMLLQQQTSQVLHPTPLLAILPSPTQLERERRFPVSSAASGHAPATAPISAFKRPASYASSTQSITFNSDGATRGFSHKRHRPKESTEMEMAAEHASHSTSQDMERSGEEDTEWEDEDSTMTSRMVDAMMAAAQAYSNKHPHVGRHMRSSREQPRGETAGRPGADILRGEWREQNIPLHTIRSQTTATTNTNLLRRRGHTDISSHTTTATTNSSTTRGGVTDSNTTITTSSHRDGWDEEAGDQAMHNGQEKAEPAKPLQYTAQALSMMH
eukprot:g63247.t1